jgi:hypothetical protein
MVVQSVLSSYHLGDDKSNTTGVTSGADIHIVVVRQ